MYKETKMLFKYFKCNTQWLFKEPGIEKILMFFFNLLEDLDEMTLHIINKNKILNNRMDFLCLSAFSDIHSLINEFPKFNVNQYRKQLKSYIKLLQYALCEEQANFQQKLIFRRSNRMNLDEIKSYCSVFNNNVNEKGFKVWNAAIITFGGLLSSCGDIVKIGKVSDVLTQLISCRNNALFAHNITANESPR